MNKLCVALFALVSLWTSSVQAVPVTYAGTLSGAAESPPNASPGTGLASATYDPDAHTLLVEVSFSDLTGPTTAAHIHCCTALPLTGVVGVASTTPTFPGFPAGTSGLYTELFDLTLLSSFNAPFVAANGGTEASAEAALATGLAEGRAYLNIHTSLFPAGEIRGFLVAVPAPAPVALLCLGLGVLVAGRAKRRD
jgi:hypothetical protein